MQYAIVELKGSQYFLEEFVSIQISAISKSVISFLVNKILLIRLINKIYIGQPYLTQVPVKVICKNIFITQNKKILIFKLKSKKKYRKRFTYKEINHTYLPLFKIL
jgi:ribosomal protein L21